MTLFFIIHKETGLSRWEIGMVQIHHENRTGQFPFESFQ